MSSKAALLINIDGSWPDDKLAAIIAEVMTESEREPYCFSINHDIRGPAFKRCPLRWDFSYADTVGIETMKKDQAQKWIATALVLGYTVSAAGPDERRRSGLKPKQAYGVSYSLQKARSRAEHSRRTDDDDIPF